MVRAASSAATALLAAAIVVRDGRTVLRYRPPAITRANARRVLSAGNPLPISALLLRRSALERPFDTGLRYLEDWNFWVENPGLFAHPIARRDVVLTRIHAHGGNKSSQYPAIGRCRERIAASRLERNDGVLGAVERNNWRLQREIGRMLQGSRPR